MKRLFSRLATLLASICLVTPAVSQQQLAQEQKDSGIPTYVVGDRWKYKNENKITENSSETLQEVKKIENENQAWVLVTNLTTGNMTWRLFDRRLSLGIATRRYDPNKPDLMGKLVPSLTSESRVQLPLYVGKTYSAHEVWDAQDGAGDLKIEVIGREKLKTAAGEFDTWVLKFSAKWSAFNDAEKWGTSVGTVWYSHEAKKTVRQEIKTFIHGQRIVSHRIDELVEWVPGAGAQK